MVRTALLMLGVSVLATPAWAQAIPTIVADMSKAKSPPPPIEPGVKGYGTRAVEGETLAAMRSSCETTTLDNVRAARCDQLRRTLQTAPSNKR